MEVSQEVLHKIHAQQQKMTSSNNNDDHNTNDNNKNDNNKNKKSLDKMILKAERQIVFSLQYGSKSFASSMKELLDQTEYELEKCNKDDLRNLGS